MTGDKTPGRRIYCNADGWFKLEPGDYVKTEPNGVWMARVPGRQFHMGTLSGHQVTEHEDGTITVSPSILHREPNVGEWHGYLERGIWREV